ncbi:unnamed protein product [Schistocephalus solidus]|uniref:Protein Lines N-terminal domain-containing protein n=1 Tax=Schistocephalus solidus TaxID=70667 RepID=A0A183TBD9_SCHSO|nr:unnamed protein product [Schistocephalus solidus]
MQEQFLTEWQLNIDIAAKHYGYSTNARPSTIFGCLEQAFSWLQVAHIPVALLGRHFLRHVLVSPHTGTAKEAALSHVFKHIDTILACSVTDSDTRLLSQLLSLVNDFLHVHGDPLLPCLFRELDSRWSRLQNRATMAVDCFFPSFSSSLLDQILRLLEKMTEFILYGSVKFSLTLKPSLFSSHESERLLAVVCNAAFSTNPDSTPLLQYLAASANVRSLEQSLLNLHPCRTLLYVIVRVAGSLNFTIQPFPPFHPLHLDLESPRLPCLLDAFGRAVVAAAGSVNYLDHHSVTSLERDAVQIFLTDDVRLFRVLWTLLQLENKLLKAGVPVMDKVPSAHQLFAELLRAICFEHFTFLDWLVSPETDCLAFLLSYCKRVIASSKTAVELNVWALPMVPSPATHYRPDPSSSHDDASGWPSQEIVAFLRRLSASLRLHESEGTMPYSPRLLISRLQAAADVIANS